MQIVQRQFNERVLQNLINSAGWYKRHAWIQVLGAEGPNTSFDTATAVNSVHVGSDKLQ
jgi:hypothetical protein